MTKHLNPAAFAAATALTMARMPRAVHAAPRADATGDPKVIFAELKTAFEEFKKSNDEKLKAKADVVLDEKVQRIDAFLGDFQKVLDDVNAKIAAIAVSAGNNKPAPRDAEFTQEYRTWMADGVETTKVKASLNKGANGEGGYLAPIEWDRTIVDKLVQVSPMRQIAQVVSTSKVGFSKLFNNRGTGSGWVGETAARPETTTPGFSPLTFTIGEIYANPAATQGILDDAEINIDEWLAGEVETEFSYQEGLAFVAGNGTNKPDGFLTYVTGAANAAKHPWGAIGLITAAGPTAILPDELMDLVYALPSEFSQNARFVMNRATLGRVRKLKDSDGNYLWQPGITESQPANLLGSPVTEVAAMPNVAASAVPIAYGDFRRGYLVVDRIGVRLLRDPYTNKPFVMFYTTKRVGGGVQDPTVLKALKMAAS